MCENKISGTIKSAHIAPVSPSIAINSVYKPEGSLLGTVENSGAMNSVKAIEECIKTGRIVEAPCIICDNGHNLIVDLGIMKGFIPREDGAIGIREGLTRDIALISRVNKPVCFKIMQLVRDDYGVYSAILSRRAAQEECRRAYIDTLHTGDIIPARVTHLEQFGCFVDVGCGIPSLIPIDAISVSRISHPSDRFVVGQKIFAAVKSLDGEKISLTHKELLGTWAENAAFFTAGETVTGLVRSVETYGIFVELSPNLAGLAELRENVSVNQHASVYIKAIIPEKMKIKLIIVSAFDNGYTNTGFNYFTTSGRLERWVYSPPECERIIASDFR